MQGTLASAGFVAHPEKSQWVPVQRLDWLGFVIDLAVDQVEVPERKLATLRDLTYKILHMDLVPARLLACLIGKIISLGLAVGPISRFMTCSFYALLESRSAWCDRLSMSTEAHAKLEF